MGNYLVTYDVPRNAVLTRRKILDAAVDEFAAHGYAGARVDRIAAAAGVNKRMIYHHFGSKLGAFEAALSDQVSGVDLTGKLARLWMHEALERGDENILRLAEREQAAATRSASPRVADGRSADPPADASISALARTALEVFPLAVPQIVRVVTGRRAASEEFRTAWSRHLHDWDRQPGNEGAKPRLRIDTARIAGAARPRRSTPATGEEVVRIDLDRGSHA